MREADYTSFIKNQIGETIEVQAYAIDTVPDGSTLMKGTAEIKGSLSPITWDYMEDYPKNKGSALMNKEVVVDCMQPNTAIQSVYFHSEKGTDVRKALQCLRQRPTYFASFNRSRLLQFFAVDLKEMSFLPFISGGAAILFSAALLAHLL